MNEKITSIIWLLKCLSVAPRGKPEINAFTQSTLEENKTRSETRCLFPVQLYYNIYENLHGAKTKAGAINLTQQIACRAKSRTHTRKENLPLLTKTDIHFYILIEKRSKRGAPLMECPRKAAADSRSRQ